MTLRHSSLGGECAGRPSLVKAAGYARAGEAGRFASLDERWTAPTKMRSHDINGKLQAGVGQNPRALRSTATARGRNPSRDSPSSFRADNSAETAARSDADRAPSAGTACAPATYAPGVSGERPS